MMIKFDKQIVYSTGQGYVAFHYGCLYHVSKDLSKCEYLCRIPVSFLYWLLGFFSLTTRLLRLIPRAFQRVDDSHFIFAFKGHIYNVNWQTGEIKCEHNFQKPMRAPLSFCSLCGINGFDDTIICGEYHGNVDHGEMSIFSRKNGTWAKCYSFPSKTVLHIHGFCVDKNFNRVLILTGDNDIESGIWAATENFKNVQPLIIGNQSYRTCIAFATNKYGILYATDTPLKDNALYLLNGVKSKRIFEMPGPCIFGTQWKDNYVFATSVEGDSRLKGARYLWTRQLGQGVKDRFVHIISGNIEDGFSEIVKLKKDCLPHTLFEFGNASFCVNSNNLLIVNPQSIFGYFEKSLIVLE